MPGISKSTFQFLKELKDNNNREWFTENKKRYEAAKAEFEVFIDALIAKIVEFDPTIGHHKAKDCVFRIYRDVRFSKDKSPYKTHFGAHVTAAAKRSEIHTRAGYYIHLEPGGSMLAGGAYLPEKDWLKSIRQEIDYNGAELHKILDSKDFKSTFGQIEGESLKTTPKGYDADHPEIALLRQKSFLATHKPSDSQVVADGFLDHAAKVFKVLHPFDEFLNKSKE
ncbi:DUF2461 domain-containing protein [Imperialibacter roseus]|uniref:DUF2461 domain-containing protein n=1 Tax=Imperialibacter roseus TaxID=1324217 RepID=A0ABZ0IUC5_9BACT|nr:DUF2461 domain-containing protein [Imperialibacter roseus]WOK07985.1 DUF2461 domain-containing protein [Imperialibacter roseus]